MKRPLPTLLLTLGLACQAQAAPPTEQSLEALFAATRVESLITSAYDSVETMMRQTTEQMVAQTNGGQPMPAKAQQVIDRTLPQVMTLMRQEFNWPQLKPHYLRLYGETFTQEEVDGMLAFYATPAGQATVNKMPLLMQKSLALSQEQMKVLLPKMMAILQRAAQDTR